MMAKIRSQYLFTLVLAAVLSGCLRPETAGPQEGGDAVIRDRQTGQEYLLNPQRRVMVPSGALTKSSAAYPTSTFDATGTIETRYWECSSGSNQHNMHIGCQVDPDFVLVGGGAYADFGTGSGALLTESRPMDHALVTWAASSKDHVRTNLHVLRVYAIGMRLAGVSRANLLAHMVLVEQTSTPAASHPTASVTLPGGYVLIGGGARDNWSGAGNLLTASYPESASKWTASGKDHSSSSPATMTAFAIGILPNIAGFGSLSISHLKSPGHYVYSGLSHDNRDVPSGSVMTCAGGQATWNGNNGGKGRLLFGMVPEPGGSYGRVRTSSKDHVNISSGTTYAHLVAVRR